uniref:Uncharacterized protein n=1 Tax=Setaria italica TaxID=4555 RepID=K3ZYE2_SETIT
MPYAKGGRSKHCQLVAVGVVSEHVSTWHSEEYTNHYSVFFCAINLESQIKSATTVGKSLSTSHCLLYNNTLPGQVRGEQPSSLINPISIQRFGCHLS